MIADEDERLGTESYGIKFRTEITIEIDAPDYLAAAEHQKRIEALLSGLRAVYPTAVMAMRPRRSVRARGDEAAPRLRHYTGRLNSYD
jgi:hypothetical protein